jgi:hypothetical protein
MKNNTKKNIRKKIHKNKSQKIQKNQKGGTREEIAKIIAEIKDFVSKSDTLRGLREETIDRIIGGILKSAPDGKSPFTYTYKIPASENYNAIFADPYGWYVRKNPNFLPIDQIPTLEVPEFMFIVHIMIKDLIVLCITQRMPQILESEQKAYGRNENNSSRMPYKYHLRSQELAKLEPDSEHMQEIVKKASKLIFDGVRVNNSGFNYSLFIEFLIGYSSLFSLGKDEIAEGDKTNVIADIQLDWNCHESFSVVRKMLETPFILLPTMGQINYVKTLDLIKAPIVNFRLSNNRRILHGTYAAPCEEFLHDIKVHGTATHGVNYYLQDIKKNNNPQIETFHELYYLKYTCLNLIKKYYTYDPDKIKAMRFENDEHLDTDILNPSEKTKFYYAIILFQIFHEYKSIDHSKDRLSILETIKFLFNFYSLIIEVFTDKLYYDKIPLGITIGDKLLDKLSENNQILNGIDRKHHLLKDLPLRTFVFYISKLMGLLLYIVNAEVLPSVKPPPSSTNQPISGAAGGAP